MTTLPLTQIEVKFFKKKIEKKKRMVESGRVFSQTHCSLTQNLDAFSSSSTTMSNSAKPTVNLATREMPING